MVDALAAQGHNITVLSVNEDPTPPKNVHYILLEGVYDFMYKDLKVDLIPSAGDTPSEAIDLLYAFGMAACLGIKRASGFQKLYNYSDDFKFDLVLYDYSLGPCVLGFLHKFNYPPMIGITAFNNPTYTTSVLGGHNYFSYIPHCAAKLDSEMSFWERAYNLYLHAFDF